MEFELLSSYSLINFLVVHMEIYLFLAEVFEIKKWNSLFWNKFCKANFNSTFKWKKITYLQKSLN